MQDCQHANKGIGNSERDDYHWGHGCGHYIGQFSSLEKTNFENKDEETDEDEEERDEDADDETDEEFNEDTDEEEYEDDFLPRAPPVYIMQGGIYIASSVPLSTRVWNCCVEPDALGQAWV